MGEVLRLNTINVHTPLKSEVYELPKTPDTPYIVDDSCFIPISEAVKQLGSNNLGASDVPNYYDFPTGVDDGREVPFSRTKNAKDIAELSSHIVDEINETTDKLKAAKDYQDRKIKFENSLADAAKNSAADNGAAVK